MKRKIFLTLLIAIVGVAVRANAQQYLDKLPVEYVSEFDANENYVRTLPGEWKFTVQVHPRYNSQPALLAIELLGTSSNQESVLNFYRSGETIYEYYYEKDDETPVWVLGFLAPSVPYTEIHVPYKFDSDGDVYFTYYDSRLNPTKTLKIRLSASTAKRVYEFIIKEVPKLGFKKIDDKTLPLQFF